jgi:predicted RNA-binding Zn-ribbon protein involved in translation (DUF1610 family)
MAVSETAATRTCPSCGSTDTVHVQRGFAGSTDETDQYFTCRECGLVTYEIVSRSERELRMHRLEPGRKFKHAGWDYTVSRVLKIGLNESLVYLKPDRRTG